MSAEGPAGTARAPDPPDLLPDPALLPRAASDRDAAIAAYRSYLEQAAGCLRGGHEAGAPAAALVRARAQAIDRLLVHAWRRLATRTGALVAVGGYGRGELHPYSDVDVMLLLDAPPEPDEVERIRDFVSLLWDVGLEAGHSVRTVDECVAEAKRDITVATTLMEARRLDGDEVLFAAMQAATARDRIWPSREFFEAKRDEQIARHHRFHDTAYRLEPNVKEGPGGLRDIQTVGWVAKRHFGARTLHELVDHGFLTEAEHTSLVEGQEFLWEVRLVLHLLANRREDRLLFDHQRRIAAEFGYLDDDANLAVEKFMKRYYRAIMELSRLNEMLLELFEEAILHTDAPQEIEDINRRFRAVNGFLEVRDPGVFERYPFALLELFLILQGRPDLAGVRASTIRLVRDHRHLIDERFRADLRARTLFLEILRQPRRVTRELRRMHRYGVLAEYLPAFGAVVGQMQYDLFHAYTVDEHSLFVVSNLRAFAVPERRDEFPLCSQIFDRLPKPELLYVAGLFHDIAKGRGGDHSELGAEAARAFCARHELGVYDSRLVEWLVRHHLLLSITAQRRDISDPAVVSQFARTVGDRTHLDYLYLLTVADIRGTSPDLWNDWKATLLLELYLAAGRALDRGLENPIDRAELVEEKKRDAAAVLGTQARMVERSEALWSTLGEDYLIRYAADEIAWHTRAILDADIVDLPLVLLREGRGGTEVFVFAPDQKYLFATTTTVLGQLGLTILDSRIITADNGMTLDSYVVLDLAGGRILETERESEIRAALREALRDPARTRERSDGRRRRRQLAHFEIRTEVAFHGDDRNGRTIMEVVAKDRPGLLGRIGWALADCDVRLQNAKIATFGERAEDVFYVTDSKNRPLPVEQHERIREQVVAAIEAGP